MLVFLNRGKSQILWMEAIEDAGETVLLDRARHTPMASAILDENLINYHPGFTFHLPFDIDLQAAPLTNCQVFSVYQPDSRSREQMIWAFSKSKEDQLLMTDRRVADLKNGKFMNFPDQKFNLPKINVYQHVLQKFNADVIRMGQMPFNPRIPVRSFQGKLATLIVFNGVLTAEAKTTVGDCPGHQIQHSIGSRFGLY